MKLYERIENNNFDEIDRNRAIELIKGGNGHLVYNENYFKLQKENEELKEENEHNKLLLNLNNNFTIDKKTGNYKWNVIEIQKVKDKIKELNSRIEIYWKYVQQGIETDVEWVDNVADRETVKVLQELIEEREEKE